MPALKLAFMGTAEFAVPSLDALIRAGHEVARVHTRPPRPAGRGQRERVSPVQAFADARGIEVRNSPEADDFAAFDAVVVAAYGRILPAAMLGEPRLGCINVHASLLPRWRGAAPIQRAILAGDAETGVTVMQMDAGLDTGPILLAERMPIGSRATAPELHDALAAMGGRLIAEALAANGIAPRPQPRDGVTYAARLERREGRVDWNEDAVLIERRIRAFAPWPGVWCEHGGKRLRFLEASVVGLSGPPGTVIGPPLTVACGAGALRIERVQRAGGAAMPADAFVRGNPLLPGAALS